jgi:hypothetical protein
MKKWILIFIGNLFSLSVFSQSAASESIEMADTMRTSGKIYVVVLVILVILAGLILYLIRLDRKIGKLEAEFFTKTKK